MTIKASLIAVAAALIATPAVALTIENQDKAELKVGIDEGNVEHVESIAGGKTGDLSAKCKEGCGLTGPWGFSWMAKPGDKLADIMIPAFAFREDTLLEEALKEALARHYPVYPVVDASGTLVGLVRGETLFANRAIAISGQSGSMVGVDKEERISTPLINVIARTTTIAVPMNSATSS